MRVTPEAYYLFDTPAAGVPELCDAFKVRSAIVFSVISRTYIHLHVGKSPCRSAAAWVVPPVARLPSALALLVGLPLLDTQHRATCQFARLAGHRTPMAAQLVCRHRLYLVTVVSRPRSLGTPVPSNTEPVSSHQGSRNRDPLGSANRHHMLLVARLECTLRAPR